MPRNQSQFDNRTRFNWGFHDAHGELENGNRRELREHGPQSLKVVSKAFDAAYYDGYRLGLMPTYASEETSTRAWDERKDV